MLSQNVIWKSFAWVYDKIVKIDFAQDTVNSSLVNKSNSLIRWQNIKVGTSLFATNTGWGGSLTLLLILLANI